MAGNGLDRRGTGAARTGPDERGRSLDDGARRNSVRLRSAAAVLILAFLATAANADAPRRSAEDRIAHPKKHEHHGGHRRSPREKTLKFKSPTERGQVLSPGETPPPT